MLSFLAKCWRQLNAPRLTEAPPLAAKDDQAEFDADWYLTAYPDVAHAGVDPWQHYQLHGKAEGRLPCQNRVLAWDHALWRGASAVILPRLTGLLEASDTNSAERLAARWALARWYAWQMQWERVVTYLLPQNDPDSVFINVDHPRMALLAIDALCRLKLAGKSCPVVLPQLVQALKQRFPDHADTYLAEANGLLAQKGSDDTRLKVINQLFAAHGLSTVKQHDSSMPLALDNLALAEDDSPLATRDTSLKTPSLPHISVIVPLYNAQSTIDVALNSLFQQRDVRLEVIVVDDASEDASVEQVKKLQDEAPSHVQLVLICHDRNQGAYAARNSGLDVASADFITTHDSDDWSHPQKLALQCQALLDSPELKACLSHWVRVTPELVFHRWRLDDYGWIYPNMSSLMFRRETFQALGYWDEVNVNADTELRLRVEAIYGKDSVGEVVAGVPLSFGLADERSLSQHTNSHLVSQFAGTRFRYIELAKRWHQAAENTAQLYMPRAPKQRPFAAPQALLRNNTVANGMLGEVERLGGFEQVSESGMLDAGWYLTRYIDLQQIPTEPLIHYWESGAHEGRDPGPDFSTSGYLRRYPDVVASGVNPLAHFLIEGELSGYHALPVWEGDRAFEGQPTVMLCAHQAGTTLFGAERSFIDVLDAMVALHWNVVVTLPEANNLTYEQALLERCRALAVLPYGWWQRGKEPVEATVVHFSALIERFHVKALHGNTVVLHEPFVAAARAGVPSLMHVRELPEHDEGLCALLGAMPEEVVAHVHNQADILVVNSRCVASAFAYPSNKPLQIVPNTIDMPSLMALPAVQFSPGERVAGTREGGARVGMLSSNVAKKGIDDLVQMASHLQSLAPFAEVVLFGARTPAIEALLNRQACGKAPANITFAGYVERPEEALAQLDIVVNLSRFQESFGRTVLEAMAAGRPVVAYNWGALNELVLEGETGFLVPFGQPLAAAQQVAKLAVSPAYCRRLGQAAQRRAETHFSATELRAALAKAYQLTRLPEFS
ncbi:glycosyltransferase [Halomonas sp. AOP13-D3-9]